MTQPSRQEGPSSTARYAWSAGLLLATGWLLYRIRGTFPIFLLGFFLAYAANPLLHKLEARGLRRSEAVQLVFLMLVAIIIVIAFVLIPLFLGQVDDFRREYQSSFRTTISEWTRDWETSVEGITPDRLRPYLFVRTPATPGESIPAGTAELPATPGAPVATETPAMTETPVTPGAPATPVRGDSAAMGSGADDGAAHLRPDIVLRLARLRDRIVPRVAAAIGAWLQRSIGSLVLLLILPIITFYFMREFDPLRRRVVFLVPSAKREQVIAIARDVNQTLSVYFRGQLLVSGLFSLAAMLILGIWALLFGMRFTLVLGFMGGILYIIPWVGMTVNVLLGATVGFMTGSNPALTAILAALTYLVLNFVFDNFVVPRLMGRQLGLHPLVIIFALLAGGEFGGILGMITAIPVAGALKAILSHLFPRLSEPVPPDVQQLVPAPDIAPLNARRRRRLGRR